MTPKRLVAEGPMPGRPSLLGKTIRVVTDGKVWVQRSLPATVVHEDQSGVILRRGYSEESLAYPFNYEVVSDG